MVLDLTCDDLHRPAAYRFASLMIDNAKVQHFSCDSKFRASIWTDFQHKIAEFARTVISRSRIRNFRPPKITFRR